MGPGQAGVDPALIQEDQSPRVERGQVGPPGGAGGSDVRAILLVRAQGLFCGAAPACAAPGTRSGRSPPRRCAPRAWPRTRPGRGRYYSPTNMPDTSDRYILDLPRDTLPFRVREYPGRLVTLALSDGLWRG
jgi:hypothetical protein